jgi:hypothetical protein
VIEGGTEGARERGGGGADSECIRVSELARACGREIGRGSSKRPRLSLRAVGSASGIWKPARAIPRRWGWSKIHGPSGQA